MCILFVRGQVGALNNGTVGIAVFDKKLHKHNVDNLKERDRAER